ncbi:MAG: hypothetical protein ACYTBZ_07055 [Planctomycetota bacterium]|jgi:hypothetical protein
MKKKSNTQMHWLLKKIVCVLLPALSIIGITPILGAGCPEFDYCNILNCDTLFFLEELLPHGHDDDNADDTDMSDEHDEMGDDHDETGDDHDEMDIDEEHDETDGHNNDTGT